MKLSTKGRYGLRAMLDLAIHSAEGHVALNSIAERQGISVNYLEQVFSALRKAGLVKSVKGAQGGYTLGDKTSNLTVGNILRVLEGDLSIIDKKAQETDKNNPVEYCIRANVWDKLNDSIDSVVDSITLEDLVYDYQELNQNLSLMFYI
ncbi:MAG: Rrf2 family transcriptional regulator [Dehalobacterium sp.]